MNSSGKKVIFLDRDGTINVDRGYVFRREDWDWTPHAIQALRYLANAGFRLVLVSNQSGVGHGLYTEAAVARLHAFMEGKLAVYGVALDAVVYCPHRRDGRCECRKPAVGMGRTAEQQLGTIDYGASWTVGDKVSDMEFGRNIGTRTALIRSAYWETSGLLQEPDLIVDCLHDAARAIILLENSLVSGRSVVRGLRRAHDIA